MLRLSNIKKNYKVADMEVPALKGINLSFRKSEFVSILGPSGCGKTTMLNIIGGLDKYSEGDLFISGRSTKEFGDRDWDIYRNHRIGFIFQSYNLIPHQTILGNVELALTIAGISKSERIEKAKRALERVGLGDQCHKYPNQLSGGQCQRVAIARALVNEPEILLADEPTGALDTVTSVQIMDLIKEISEERLVIMVTHNPELAEKYSTRIVRLLDGNVIEDSNPFSEEEEIEEVREYQELLDEKFRQETEVLTEKELKAYKKNQKENAKMSMWTAFKLSARNLKSKFKRTMMVVVAGSIGIIGVATVLSVSTGVNDYIDTMQDDLLSGNPITIQKSGIDYNAMMSEATLTDKREILEAGDWVNINSMIQYLFGNQEVLMSLMYNNEFDKNYLDYVKSMPKEYYNSIALNYGIDVTTNIYTEFKVDDTTSDTMSLHSITKTYTALIEEFPEYEKYASAITSLTSVMSQCIPDNDFIESQYTLLDGDLPKNENDVLVVVDSDSKLTDLLLAQLGYYSQEEFFNIFYKASNSENYDETKYKTKFEYDEIRRKSFTWYPNDTVFAENPIEEYKANLPFVYQYKEQEAWNDGIELNICGIVKPNDEISYGCLRSGFLYSEDLARTMISKNIESKIVKWIEKNGPIGNIDLSSLMNNTGGSLDTSKMTAMLYQLEYTFEGEKKPYTAYVGQENQMIQMMDMMGIEISLPPMITASSIGGSYIPESISIYPLDFDNKNLVTDYLDKWNSEEDVTFNVYSEDFKEILETKTLSFNYTENGEDLTRHEIKYTDAVGLIISMIKTMVNVITYALVAFTALSLVVSTVMVGIITYVSVVERIKEIGVIRSLGGRKKDVSHLFNAETFMIGLFSGVFGIAFTGLISLLINGVVKAASDGAINGMAHLTLTTSVVMVVLSVALTLISGLIPARAAAKKNPVEALRTE